MEKGRLAEMQQIEVISKAIASKDVLKEKAEVRGHLTRFYIVLTFIEILM